MGRTKQLHLFVAAKLIATGVVGLLAYGLAAPGATLLGPALSRGRTPAAGPRQVALTFDDGPSAPFTAEILDILREKGVHATFFICGQNAERHHDLVRRIHAEGHEIGNHTYTHPYLYLMGRKRIASEIDRTQEVLERLTGRRPTLFRPPFGVRWFSLWPVLRERRMTLVTWSVWGREGARGQERIARDTLEHVDAGAIILLHDGHETRSAGEVDRSATVRALPRIIEGIQHAGYAFVRVSELGNEPHS